eukprot:scaffold591_cov121-Isochrysis_galbana.AAC.6
MRSRIPKPSRSQEMLATSRLGLHGLRARDGVSRLPTPPAADGLAGSKPFMRVRARAIGQKRTAKGAARLPHPPTHTHTPCLSPGSPAECGSKDRSPLRALLVTAGVSS